MSLIGNTSPPLILLTNSLQLFFVSFTFTNFGGRSKKADYIVLISNYVIARSDSICRAVAIPRKGSARLRLFVAIAELQVEDI